jgi:hypothetical protein
MKGKTVDIYILESVAISGETVKIYILESVAISRGNSGDLYIRVGSDIKGKQWRFIY